MIERRLDPKIIQIIKKAWTTLVNRRQMDSSTNIQRFTDNEADVGLLKDIDALNTLLEPYLLSPMSFVDLPIKIDELENHIKTITDEISSRPKDESKTYYGFSAAPYPYVQWITDHVDSAASFLKLACNACAVLKIPGIEKKDLKIENFLKEPCINAIDFLLSARIEEKDGVRWQGIARLVDPPGRFANLFFTNLAALSLFRAMGTPTVVRWMGQERREQIESALKGVINWVLGQYNPTTKVFHMDAAKASSPAVGTLCALEILYTLDDFSSETQKLQCTEALREIVAKFQDSKQATSLQIDVFHAIPPPSGNINITQSYDDRRYIGAFLSIFSLAKQKTPAVVDEAFLHAGKNLFQLVSDDWIDDPSGMWDDGRPLICFTQDAIIGLVQYLLHGQTDVISLREHEMRSAIQEALRSEDVLNAIVTVVKAKSLSSKPIFKS